MNPKRRGVRSFGNIRLLVAHEDGQAVGSIVEAGNRKWTLPHWPSRIKDIKESNDFLVVSFKSGSPPSILDATNQLVEATTGSSMGGHSPKAHGKIRYIVRAFGKWAKGKHSVCVRTLMERHPEIAPTEDKANRLCAWMKDQWAGTTKWRGDQSNPRLKKREEGIRKRAHATAYARFTHNMPQVSPQELDQLVEDVRQLTGESVEDVLQELGVDSSTGGDPYELLAEHDAQLNADLLDDCKDSLKEALKKRQTHEYKPLIAQFLALHGDAAELTESAAELKAAAERIVTGAGSLQAGSTAETRILEAQTQHFEERTKERSNRKNKKKGGVTVSQPKNTAPGNGRGNPYHAPAGSPAGGEFTKKPSESKSGGGKGESGLFARHGFSRADEKAANQRITAKAAEKAASKAETAKNKAESEAKKAEKEKRDAWEAQHAREKAASAGIPTGGSALKAWQERHDIYPSGQIDAQTISKIKSETTPKKSKTRKRGAQAPTPLTARERRMYEGGDEVEQAYSGERTVHELFEAAPQEEAEKGTKAGVEFDPFYSDVDRFEVVQEGEERKVGELERNEYAHLPMDELLDRARELYEATISPTPEGRQRLATAGRDELAFAIKQMEGLFEEASQRKEPPNLRRMTESSACGNCAMFDEGDCNMFFNYPVSEGEVCDEHITDSLDTEEELEEAAELDLVEAAAEGRPLSADEEYWREFASAHLQEEWSDEARAAALAARRRNAGFRSPVKLPKGIDIGPTRTGTVEERRAARRARLKKQMADGPPVLSPEAQERARKRRERIAKNFKLGMSGQGRKKMEEGAQPRRPKGSPDRNSDGKGDGGQFASTGARKAVNNPHGHPRQPGLRKYVDKHFPEMPVTVRKHLGMYHNTNPASLFPERRITKIKRSYPFGKNHNPDYIIFYTEKGVQKRTRIGPGGGSRRRNY
jgi:hypothetical protein